MFRLFAHHHHKTSNPWASAPPWALELREMIGLVLQSSARTEKRDVNMSVTLDKATASLAGLTNAADAIEKVVDTLAEEIRNVTDDPAVLAVLDQVDAKSAEIVAKALANTPAVSDIATASNPAIREAAAAANIA